MTLAILLMTAFAAAGFAQDVPEGYRTVYITSMVDQTYVIQPTTPAAGSAVVVQTSAEAPEQQWYVLDGESGDSSIQLAGTTLCLDAGPESNWKDMAAITLEECVEAQPSQLWNFMGDGRIALGASSPAECIDLQYMRATPNNPVGLYSCAGLGNSGAADAGINWPLVEVATV